MRSLLAASCAPQRYVNDDPIDEIMAEYKRHVAYVDDETPGGFEALNERFIREFDTSLLDAEEIVFEDGFELDEDLVDGVRWDGRSAVKCYD